MNYMYSHVHYVGGITIRSNSYDLDFRPQQWS